MFIKCWGSRGSIPVSGLEYIKYGGDTTCLEIRTKSDDIIIVDAGTGIRRLGNKLVKEGRYRFNILFTHAHWDHLMGFPFFKPLFIKKAEIKAFKCPFPGSYVEDMILKILAPPNFPVKYSDLSASIVYEEAGQGSFQIGSVTIEPINISHPNGGSGYKFIEDNKSFVFLTDNELGFVHPGGFEFDAYLEFSKGADLLIHDAEYTPDEYSTQIEWGHSSYADVLDLAFKAKVKKLGLFHLNQERTDDEMDEIVKDCQRIANTKNNPFDCFAVGVDMEFNL
ncbi:MAG: MBL fold metallo-hydrolase [Deltaproteobacteria bacterium]|nr:MBL fold metallo-hydrolase [Deltaproteobacteria bacterium]MBW2219666.1 MBL fold metallo-hydrolase [Deltaproteobacteria bacterium]